VPIHNIVEAREDVRFDEYINVPLRVIALHDVFLDRVMSNLRKYIRCQKKNYQVYAYMYRNSSMI
jgi:hypothetical protein